MGGAKEVVGTPTYFPMRNTATDPTDSNWPKPAGYVFVPYDGIYTDVPVTDMYAMLHKSTFNDPDVAQWDTSQVTNMGSVFDNNSAFNQDIGGWNTSQVTNMGYMFYNTAAFNQDIGEWDTSQVTNMTQMFYIASAFNQDLSGWCVSKIPSKPFLFDNSTTAWVKSGRQPIWGTCP